MRYAPLLLLLTSCATIAHGTKEAISIDSTPSGASVALKCQQVASEGTTPARLIIPRNATDCVVTVSQSGYRPKSVTLDRGVARQYWLNFIGVAMVPIGISDNSPVYISDDLGLAALLSGALGLGIDAFDGAMFHHTPAEIRVVLESQ
jgi:hypothetical protein